jgi:uncharacterized protein (TIGR00299 family) protein
MRIAYFDTVGGIAGDMTLAAFVAAGLPFETLSSALQELNLEGFELSASHVRRNGIEAVHIDVIVTHQPEYHRHLKDILAILDASSLTTAVKEKAAAIFRTIAVAEAAVHKTSVDSVHFHEVGAVDSIVDIVGAAFCLEHFRIDRVYSSPVRLGSGGFVETEHGMLPTPTPAVLEILKGYPTVLTTIPDELTTPTGAAIIKTLSTGILDDQHLRIERTGYGAGSREISGIPGFLRVLIGDLDTPLEEDHVLVVETNIDDMNPQAYPYVIERLLAAGAHDAYLVPIIMKKGRPGILLSVITGYASLDAVVALLYRETSTIGLRIQHTGRKKLIRSQREAMTSFGPVKVKSVLRDGTETLAPEYEECKRIADTENLPLLAVMKRLEREISDESPRHSGDV